MTSEFSVTLHEPQFDRPGPGHALATETVTLGWLGPDGALPVCQSAEPIDASRWAEERRDAIHAAVLDAGALLLRGFEVAGPADFVRLAEALSPEMETAYTELPRVESGERCYRSTPYPDSLPILFHNESAHRSSWPVRQFFCCLEPSAEGGATPIADGRRVLEALDPSITKELRERGLLYLRNFSEAFDLEWREYYGCDSESGVEAACHSAGTEFEWLPQGLRTWQRCPALVKHPETREELPFHQILLHHPACLPPDARRALEAELAEDAMPRNVFFGDGDRIDDSTVAAIQAATEAAAIRFAWHPGDVVVFDNVRMAHSRDAFSGTRSVLVALGAFFRCDGPERNAVPVSRETEASGSE